MFSSKKVFIRPSVLIRRGWVKKVFAINKLKLAVAPADPGACAWCLVGAIRRSFGFSEKYIDFTDRVKQLLIEKNNNPYLGLMSWNDDVDRKQEEVIALLEEAENLTPEYWTAKPSLFVRVVQYLDNLIKLLTNIPRS